MSLNNVKWHTSECNSHYEKFADGRVVCIDDEIPFEIPTGWEWARIRNISQSYIGLTYSPTEVSPQGTIVLRSSNIKEGKLYLGDIVRVNKTIPEKLWVEKNDIVICARNGSKKLVGKSAIVQEINEPMTFGAFMAICKTPLWQFVYYFLQSDLFFAQLREVSGTTTINQLTQNSFNSFLLPIPPSGEQEKISEKLQMLLPIVEKYGKQQEALEELNNSLKQRLQKSVLQEAIQGQLVLQDPTDEPASTLLNQIRLEKQKLLKEGRLKRKDIVDSFIFKGEDNKYYEKIGNKCLDISEEIPFDIPETWCWIRIGDYVRLVTDFVASGSFASLRENVHYYKTENYAILVKTQDFQHNFQKDLTYTDEHGYEFLSGSNLHGGELIISNVGSIGKVFIVPDLKRPMTLAPNAIMIKAFEDIHIPWLYSLLSSSFGHNSMMSISSATAMRKFNKTDFKKILIPVPPIAEQKRIAQQIQVLLRHL